jgi:hypothetical protein
MKTLSHIKTQSTDFTVEYEIVDNNSSNDTEWIESEIAAIDLELQDLRDTLCETDKEIQKYTNHSDKLDYSIAVASGLLCGLVDAFFVGDLNLEDARAIVSEKINQKIIKLAKKKGYTGIQRGERKGQFLLDKCIEYLENKYKMPSDPCINIFGGSKQHHLRDFAHHHSIIGLFFSILTQFTGKAYGTDTYGNFITAKVPEELIGKDFRKKMAIAITDWSLHLASDMAGSHDFAGGGAGIPGPILSLLKVISALPIFKSDKVGGNKLSLFVSKLYNGTLLAHKDENGKIIPVKIDLRGEYAIRSELRRQCIPVVMNECIVRSFYLLRRLYIEIKANDIREFSDIVNKINWSNVNPVGNRTITRMMTVASGTFTAVDMSEATIRSAIKSGGDLCVFGTQMLLKVNYVGVGRFAIAVGRDVHMGMKQHRLINERTNIISEMLLFSNAKLYYRQAEMWETAETAEKAVENAYNAAEKSCSYVYASVSEISNSIHMIEESAPSIEAKNKGLSKEIIDIIKY